MTEFNFSIDQVHSISTKTWKANRANTPRLW